MTQSSAANSMTFSAATVPQEATEEMCFQSAANGYRNGSSTPIHRYDGLPIRQKEGESLPVFEMQKPYMIEERCIPSSQSSMENIQYYDSSQYVLVKREDSRERKLEEEGESFTNQAYYEVVKPIGQGIAAPIAGVAGAAGSLLFGAASVCRGVLGAASLYVDWVVKPVADGLHAGVHWCNDSGSTAADPFARITWCLDSQSKPQQLAVGAPGARINPQIRCTGESEQRSQKLTVEAPRMRINPQIRCTEEPEQSSFRTPVNITTAVPRATQNLREIRAVEYETRRARPYLSYVKDEQGSTTPIGTARIIDVAPGNRVVVPTSGSGMCVSVKPTLGSFEPVTVR